MADDADFEPVEEAIGQARKISSPPPIPPFIPILVSETSSSIIPSPAAFNPRPEKKTRLERHLDHHLRKHPRTYTVAVVGILVSSLMAIISLAVFVKYFHPAVGYRVLWCLAGFNTLLSTLLFGGMVYGSCKKSIPFSSKGAKGIAFVKGFLASFSALQVLFVFTLAWQAPSSSKTPTSLDTISTLTAPNAFPNTQAMSSEASLSNAQPPLRKSGSSLSRLLSLEDTPTATAPQVFFPAPSSLVSSSLPLSVKPPPPRPENSESTRSSSLNGTSCVEILNEDNEVELLAYLSDDDAEYVMAPFLVDGDEECPVEQNNPKSPQGSSAARGCGKSLPGAVPVFPHHTPNSANYQQVDWVPISPSAQAQQQQTSENLRKLYHDPEEGIVLPEGASVSPTHLGFLRVKPAAQQQRKS